MERLLLSVDPPRSGEANMETDFQLLQKLQAASEPRTIVRFYRWDRPTASIGKHQIPEKALDSDYCFRAAIPVVRRPTGGRAVFHADEVTYAFVSNHPSLVRGPGVSRASRLIAAGLREGLVRIGLQTDSPGRTSRRTPCPRSAVKSPCFASTSQTELSVGQLKLAGSAQCRLPRAILQHGSIPLRIDFPVMSQVLGCTEFLLKSHMTSVSAALGREIGFEELVECLAEGLRWLDDEDYQIPE